MSVAKGVGGVGKLVPVQTDGKVAQVEKLLSLGHLVFVQKHLLPALEAACFSAADRVLLVFFGT